MKRVFFATKRAFVNDMYWHVQDLNRRLVFRQSPNCICVQYNVDRMSELKGAFHTTARLSCRPPPWLGQASGFHKYLTEFLKVDVVSVIAIVPSSKFMKVTDVYVDNLHLGL